jgi:hypothetical protein
MNPRTREGRIGQEYGLSLRKPFEGVFCSHSLFWRSKHTHGSSLVRTPVLVRWIPTDGSLLVRTLPAMGLVKIHGKSLSFKPSSRLQQRDTALPSSVQCSTPASTQVEGPEDSSSSCGCGGAVYISNPSHPDCSCAERIRKPFEARHQSDSLRSSPVTAPLRSTLTPCQHRLRQFCGSKKATKF